MPTKKFNTDEKSINRRTNQRKTNPRTDEKNQQTDKQVNRPTNKLTDRRKNQQIDGQINVSMKKNNRPTSKTSYRRKNNTKSQETDQYIYQPTKKTIDRPTYEETDDIINKNYRQFKHTDEKTTETIDRLAWGSHPTTTVSSVALSPVMMSFRLSARLSWVIITPFGSLVEPGAPNKSKNV